MKRVALLAILGSLPTCNPPVRGRDPDIVVRPSVAILFSKTLVGTTARSDVVVRNLGNGTLRVGEVSLENGTPAPFALDGAPTAPIELMQGESLSFGLLFSPTTGDTANDFLRVASNDPDQPLVRLEVRALNVGAHLRVDPPRIDFGLIWGRSGPVTATVHNDGTLPVTLRSVSLSGNDTEFAVTDVSAPAGTVLEPGDDFSLKVSHTLNPDSTGKGAVVIASEEPGAPEARLELLAPPVAKVGQDLFPEPLETVMLDASMSRAPGNQIGAYRWTVAEAPPDSQTAQQFAQGGPQSVREKVHCPGQQAGVVTPCFFPDVPGTYLFALEVVDRRASCALGDPGDACDDDAGCCSFDCRGPICAPPTASHVCAESGTGCEIHSDNTPKQRVKAIPEQALFVTLTWDGDGDMDLHLVRGSGADVRWTSAVDDAHHGNVQPEWGLPDETNQAPCEKSVDCTQTPFLTCKLPDKICVDTSDDPRLVIDNVKAFGPEAIGIKLPPKDTYHVGVHYFPGISTQPPRRATVRFFVLGEERFPMGRSQPLSVVLDRNDFWTVGRIVYTGILADAAVEESPLSSTNPAANAEPKNYPTIP